MMKSDFIGLRVNERNIAMSAERETLLKAK